MLELSSMESLRKYWVIIIFLGGLIATWTLFSARLSNAEDKIGQLTTVNEQIKQIQIDVAVIKEKTSNENIKLQVQQGVSDALQNYEINN